MSQRSPRMARMTSRMAARMASANAITTTAAGAKSGSLAERVPLALDVLLWVRHNAGVVGIYAFLTVMTIFSLFPIYFVVQASLNSTQALISTDLQLLPSHPTLGNYTFVISQLPFLRWMWNSILVCALATIIALVCATTGAYALARFRFPGRQSSLLVLIALQTFPGLLAIYAYYSILSALHLDGTPIGLAVVYAAGNIVFGVWNIKGYFDTLPVELEEAARVDGASNFDTFWRIILPLSGPALAASALFMFIGGWNEFVLAKLILNPDPNSLTVPVGLFQLQQDQYTPWGYFAASSVIVSVPLMLLFLYLQRFFKAGLTIGSVKG
jgi:arabinogalactan oligomer / maltooligosaccharide transport system permease protein